MTPQESGPYLVGVVKSRQIDSGGSTAHEVVSRVAVATLAEPCERCERSGVVLTRATDGTPEPRTCPDCNGVGGLGARDFIRRTILDREEARIDRVGWVEADISAGQRAHREVETLPATGGTVTLPDGTLITVEQTTWLTLWEVAWPVLFPDADPDVDIRSATHSRVLVAANERYAAQSAEASS